MSNINKFRYSILFFLIIFFVLLQYSIYFKNFHFLNIALFVYLPLWVLCVLFELVRDIKLKENNSFKYCFFILHSILLYGLITKTVNVVRPDTPFSLLLFMLPLPLFYPIVVIYDLLKRFYKHNNKIKDNLIHICWLIALVSILNIYEIGGIGLDIDKLVFQDREEIINHYQELCLQNYYRYIKEDYIKQDKNNMFSQKYRVVSSCHSNSENCVSISNTYFDPNLSMRKCGNEEIIITAKWLKYIDN